MQNKKGILNKKIKAQLARRLNGLSVWMPICMLWIVLCRPGENEIALTGMLSGIISFPFVYGYSMKVFNGYDTEFQEGPEQYYSMTLGVLFADFISLCIFILFYGMPAGWQWIAGCLLVQLAFNAVWSLAIYRNKKNEKGLIKQNSLLICSDYEKTHDVLHERDLNKYFEFDQIWEAGKDEIRLPEIRRFSQIVLDLRDTSASMAVMKTAMEHHIPVYAVPQTDDIIRNASQRVFISHLPAMQMDGYNPSVEYLVLKRAIDICVSSAALILLAPVMLTTALLIWCEDHGPVFYSQKRLTQNGREFDVLKFRSMRVDAEAAGIRLSSGKADSRVTRIGKIIRACRIDELPQLINILKGDMTIVGPRPERPEIASQYEEAIPEFRLRLLAKAGLTGTAQVYGKYNTAPQDKLQMDLMYIASPSIMEDFSLMLATVKILLLPESTEGVAEGASTALKKNRTMPAAELFRERVYE